MKNTNEIKIEVCLNTWGNYNNNGACGAVWVTLPMKDKDLNKLLKMTAERMGDSDPEWFINDYEQTTAITLSECWGPHYINEILNEINSYWTDEDIGALIAYAEVYNSDLITAYEFVQSGNFEFYEGATLEDMANEWIDSYDLPTEILGVINYNWVIDRFRCEGYDETERGVLLVW